MRMCKAENMKIRLDELWEYDCQKRGKNSRIAACGDGISSGHGVPSRKIDGAVGVTAGL